MNNRLRFDLDLWCFRGRVFGFPACSSGHSGSVRTFARTKGRDGLVPFLGVLGAFRQPSLKGHRQYVPAFSKYSPNAIAWQRNPALVRDRTILGTATSPSTALAAWRIGSVRPGLCARITTIAHLFRPHGLRAARSTVERGWENWRFPRGSRYRPGKQKCKR
jgi:hypothetical protein